VGLGQLDVEAAVKALGRAIAASAGVGLPVKRSFSLISWVFPIKFVSDLIGCDLNKQTGEQCQALPI
jgi:hypothetical protein